MIKRITGAVSLCAAMMLSTSVFAVEPIQLNGKSYAYNSSEEFTHSYFTGADKDKESWNEKVSVIFSSSTRSEDDLEELANDLRDGYSQNGRLVKAIKIAAKDGASTKFVVVGVMSGEEVAEGIMARASLVDGHSVVLMYSHRFYNENREKELIDWFEANGFNMEKELIDFAAIPSRAQFAAK
ncbi:hypothetical protein [Neptuniibacter sp. QD48_11]|uniref:hypothetical protein n=1 Tax=unclassified Neptuniibacter TaxID=2630693 RepID=UPI0039F59380